MRKGTMFLAVALCLGLLNGCGAARPSRFYELTVPGDRTSVADSSRFPFTLLLGPITTSYLYRDDHIVYTSTGEAMGTYEYERWAEPLPEMIDDVLLRKLRSSGRYPHVYSLRSNMRSDYLLRGHLYDCREISENGLAARVSFEFELRDSKTGTTVWNLYYSHDEPVNEKTVSAVVAAMDRNVQSGLSQIVGGLEQYFSARTQSSQ